MTKLDKDDMLFVETCVEELHAGETVTMMADPPARAEAFRKEIAKRVTPAELKRLIVK